jgi:hypothetical protein
LRLETEGENQHGDQCQVNSLNPTHEYEPP